MSKSIKQKIIDERIKCALGVIKCYTYNVPSLIQRILAETLILESVDKVNELIKDVENENTR